MRTKKAKKAQTGKFSGLKIINHDVAGIDVGATLMQICVPADRDTVNNRAFGTYTEDLRQISAWLRQCRITKVIMESTGIYWVQLFRLLQQDGFEVYLVNAADAKNMSGRKTDVDDAEWLMVLLTACTSHATSLMLSHENYAHIPVCVSSMSRCHQRRYSGCRNHLS